MNHKNFAQTTLASAITDTGGTSITVTSETSFPAVQFIISIDTEAMLVTNVTGTTWTVTRGYEGSTAATHLNGTAIFHDVSAAEADSIAAKKTDNVSATDKILGRVTAGAGAIEEIACTAAGRALLDDANTAAQLETLGAFPDHVTSTDAVLGNSMGPGGVQEIGISEQRVLGRITGGHTGGLTAAQIRTLINVADGANNYSLPDEAVTYAKMQHISATDKVLGRSTAGAGDVEEIACTAAGRALLDDANAAAQLATLGAAAASAITNVDNTSDATKNAAAVTVTNHRFTRRVDTQTTTDTITPEISTYDIFIRTAQAHALVINNHSSSTPVDGDMMLFEILGDATIRAVTYGDKYVAKAGVALPAATVASKNLTMLFIWRADLTQWVLLSAGQEA